MLEPENYFADVTFEVEGRSILAHRVILAARSGLFKNIFLLKAGLDPSKYSDKEQKGDRREAADGTQAVDKGKEKEQ